jgi:4-diphosphocytidyl-2-C-methyl-D-erythritol kinase
MTGEPGRHLSVIRFPPAKLNLTLAVLGTRGDGYHALHSVMVPLALTDALAVSRRPAPNAQDSLRVSGFEAGPTADNLVLRAIALAREAVRSTWPGAPSDPSPLAARLTKRIPVSAGLAGGSSDAAAALQAALEAWGADLPRARLTEIAAALGSDVPFFLAGGAALVTGRGEFIEPLPNLAGQAPAVLLVTPNLPISTAAVFGAYARGVPPVSAQADLAQAPSANAVSERLAADMRAGLTAAALLDRAEELAWANDLMPAAAAVAPELPELRESLAQLLGRPVGQSGSGPTAWVLYPSLAAARKAARFVRFAALGGQLPQVGSGTPFIGTTTILGRSASGGFGPAPGSLDREPPPARWKSPQSTM